MREEGRKIEDIAIKARVPYTYLEAQTVRRWDIAEPQRTSVRGAAFVAWSRCDFSETRVRAADEAKHLTRVVLTHATSTTLWIFTFIDAFAIRGVEATLQSLGQSNFFRV